MTGIPVMSWQAVMMTPLQNSGTSPFLIGTNLIFTQAGLSQVSTFALPNQASDTLVGQTAPATLSGKTMDWLLQNTASGVYQASYNKRCGGFQPLPTAASAGSQGLDGALAANTHFGASFSNPSWDMTYGLFQRYATAATANSKAGIISPTAGIGCAITNLATRVIARVRLNTATAGNVRQYFGFTSNTTLPISDTPLANGDSGILIGYRSTDSNWMLFNNDGTGAEVVASFGQVYDTNWHTLMISWPLGATSVTAQLDNLTPITVTTRLPGANTGLFFNSVGQTVVSSAVNYDVHGIFLETAG